MAPYIASVVFAEWDNSNVSYTKSFFLGFASSYADAAKTIEDCYGPELISINSLELLEETDIVYLPESILKNIAADVYFAEAHLACDAEGKVKV